MAGRATALTSANEDVYRLYRQSIEDMGALRLHDQDFAPDVWVPAAGVPWFVTVFGRDSLIVSLQNMLVSPGFARGALRKLAQHQATEMDDWRDAEPGKIPHELRVGELAHFRRVPHTPYYGTADATPLYLIVLHEAWKWSGDERLLRDYHDVALRCLDWIDRYGDLDGDGFQEYRTRSTLGYENVGWKDSAEAVVYPDGSQVKQPRRSASSRECLRCLDAHGRGVRRAGRAAAGGRAAPEGRDLRARFEERFWCEDIGSYAYGLDPEKQPIRTIASNAGHCLWSGIASPEHAARVVERFLQPDMWSGWGIRTLSARNPAYNPYSYQLGSVWPHDNGIIALGFKRYGFAAEAGRVARDISEAASYFVSYRLPELYAGVERGPGTFPVQYLGANVPQAWAAGPSSICSRRSSACGRMHPNAGSTSIPSFHRGCLIWRSEACKSARGDSIPGSGARAPRPAGTRRFRRVTLRSGRSPGAHGRWSNGWELRGRRLRRRSPPRLRRNSRSYAWGAARLSRF